MKTSTRSNSEPVFVVRCPSCGSMEDHPVSMMPVGAESAIVSICLHCTIIYEVDHNLKAVAFTEDELAKWFKANPAQAEQFRDTMNEIRMQL